MRILALASSVSRASRAGAAVADAVRRLIEAGHDVVVVAGQADGGAALPARTVLAAEYPPMLAEFDEGAWLLQLNIAMFERASIELDRASVDVVHGFGLAVAHAAVSLKRTFDVPLVMSITPNHADGGDLHLLRDADRIVVASRPAAQRLEAPHGRVAIVRAGRGYGTRLTSLYREAVHAGLSPVSR